MNRLFLVRCIVVLVVCYGLALPLSAQQLDPVSIVQQQLDTYNNQDIDGFAAVFADDAKVFYNLGDSTATLVGRPAIRERYSQMFRKYPENRSILIGRMVQGNFVFDHEWINNGEQTFKIVAIYEVVDGLIQRCWFAR